MSAKKASAIFYQFNKQTNTEKPLLRLVITTGVCGHLKQSITRACNSILEHPYDHVSIAKVGTWKARICIIVSGSSSNSNNFRCKTICQHVEIISNKMTP